MISDKPLILDENRIKKTVIQVSRQELVTKQILQSNYTKQQISTNQRTKNYIIATCFYSQHILLHFHKYKITWDIKKNTQK